MLSLGGVSAASLFLVSCAGGPQGPTGPQLEAANQQAIHDDVPPSLRSDYVDLLTQGERQYVLNAMRVGLGAVRVGQIGLAKRVFDQAIKREQALQEGSAQAKRAKSKFVPDDEKWFKGESYERAALYLYRGLLYAADQDWGNAAACAKRAQIEDIAFNEQDAGDWYSAEWLLALASLKQGDPGTAADALRRAAKFSSKQGNVPPPKADDNVLIVAEAGHGPIKVAIGEYREKLIYEQGEVRTVKLSVSIPPAPAEETAPAESLYVQATTRGPRKVDHLLQGKAEFKEATDIAGTGAIVAGAATAMTSNNDTQSLVGLGLVAAGIVTKAVSASSRPEADTRTWDNLPNSVFLYSLKCPVGTSRITFKALGADGRVLKEETRDIVISSTNSLTLVWTTLP